MAKIIIKCDNREFEVKDGTPALDVLINEDVSIEFSCEEGICSTCECVVLEGAENLSKPTDREKDMLYLDGEDKDKRLACQFTVLKGKVVLDPSENYI